VLVLPEKAQGYPIENMVSMVDDALQKYCHPGAIYDQYHDNGKQSETEWTGDPLIFHVAELLALDEDYPVAEREQHNRRNDPVSFISAEVWPPLNENGSVEVS
jgi:hypothetical protein